MPNPVTRPMRALISRLAAITGGAEPQRPGQAVSDLRADLRIGGDAAGVVIRRPGDQARPQHLEQLPAGRLPGLVAHRVVRHVVPPVRLSGPYGRQLANATLMSWVA